MARGGRDTTDERQDAARKAMWYVDRLLGCLDSVLSEVCGGIDTALS